MHTHAHARTRTPHTHTRARARARTHARTHSKIDVNERVPVDRAPHLQQPTGNRRVQLARAHAHTQTHPHEVNNGHAVGGEVLEYPRDVLQGNLLVQHLVLEHTDRAGKFKPTARQSAAPCCRHDAQPCRRWPPAEARSHTQHSAVRKKTDASRTKTDSRDCGKTRTPRSRPLAG